jgi:putative Holliday junction resolvase
MKIIALDIGDTWTGIAISDALGMFAQPHNTVATHELQATLQDLFTKEKINIVVVGYPKTMKGTESEQTKKIVAQKEQLALLFPTLTWILWDERLSSKRAETLKKNRTKEEKLRSHAIAASFILDSYLTYRQFNKNPLE